MADTWLPSLITATPQEGFELAITLSRRGVKYTQPDMETLKHTNEQLISTLDEVLQIQTDGAKKRQEAEAELRRLEGELKQKLLQPRS